MTFQLITARGVKEVIHRGFHPNNIDRNNGIKIPEAIPMIRKHNERLVQQQTAGETTWSHTSQKTKWEQW